MESTLANKQNACSAAEWTGQGFGIWGANGEGWFTEEAILRAREAAKREGIIPVLSRHQFEALRASQVFTA